MRNRTLSGVVLAGVLVIQVGAFNNCGVMTPVGSISSSTAGSTGQATVTAPLNQGTTSSNVMSVSVGNCGSSGYFNEPCVTVIVCQPGTNTCASIPNILLDTGSYGLRVFGSALTSYGLNLTQLTSPQGFPLLECAQFGSGSMWGPVQSADVGLGGEPRVNVPIQVVNSAYTAPTGSSACPNLITDPSTGYNGILGVGVLFYDCGTYCVTNSAINMYFSCITTSSCTSVAVPLASQIVNPIGKLPVDNNGVILSFPSVTSSGVAAMTGTMTIGIGTSTNNFLTGASVFNADQYANFTTNYKGTSDNQSFIDSGSNALYFPDSAITQCTNATGFYCPKSQLTLTAIQQSQSTSVSQLITFSVGNTDTLLSPFSATDGALNNIGGKGSALQFDWGLPFFLGRTIGVGLESKASNLASGPYWAY